MGLLSQAVMEGTPLCKFGLILDRQLANADGHVLEDDDITSLIEARERGMGAPAMTGALLGAQFSIGQSAIARHLQGVCTCPTGTTLKGVPRGAAR